MPIRSSFSSPTDLAQWYFSEISFQELLRAHWIDPICLHEGPRRPSIEFFLRRRLAGGCVCHSNVFHISPDIACLPEGGGFAKKSVDTLFLHFDPTLALQAFFLRLAFTRLLYQLRLAFDQPIVT